MSFAFKFKFQLAELRFLSPELLSNFKSYYKNQIKIFHIIKEYEQKKAFFLDSNRISLNESNFGIEIEI